MSEIKQIFFSTCIPEIEIVTNLNDICDFALANKRLIRNLLISLGCIQSACSRVRGDDFLLNYDIILLLLLAARFT